MTLPLYTCIYIYILPEEANSLAHHHSFIYYGGLEVVDYALALPVDKDADQPMAFKVALWHIMVSVVLRGRREERRERGGAFWNYGFVFFNASCHVGFMFVALSCCIRYAITRVYSVYGILLCRMSMRLLS